MHGKRLFAFVTHPTALRDNAEDNRRTIKSVCTCGHQAFKSKDKGPVKVLSSSVISSA